MHDSTFERHGTSICIPTPHPFNWTETIRYLTRSSNECLFRVIDNVVYRLLRVPEQDVLIEIAGNDTELKVRTHGNRPLLAEQWDVISGFVRDWFDLDAELMPFYERTRDCPLLKDLGQALYGLRVIGIPDLFEAICWAIMGQQINLTFAYTLKRRFVESFGDVQVWDDQQYWLFPKPETIVRLSADDLVLLKFTRRKAETVLDVARLMASGALSKADLMALDDMQLVKEQLLQIRGLGPWSVNYVLMRCLRDSSALPITDVGLRNAVRQKLGTDRKPTLDELKSLSEQWARWEAYAVFYLWQSLQTVAKP